MAENDTCMHMNQQPHTSHKLVGIVGGGFGGLLTFIVLRWRGVLARDIVVFSPEGSPESSWVRFAHAIKQQDMRSESTGHFFPTDSPGLATIAALRGWSLKPIVLSWFDQYRPAVEVILKQARQLALQTGFWTTLKACRIERITKHGNEFYIYDQDGELCGIVQHLVIAVGHGRRAIPAPVQKFWDKHPGDTRVVHAFDEKEYLPGATTLVIGDGLTAATEWSNVFERDSRVIGVSRLGFSFGQALNTPRRYFSKRGFGPYRELTPEQRLKTLRSATRGTIPNYSRWYRLFQDKQNTGDLKLLTGDVTSIDPSGDGRLHVSIRLPDGHGVLTVIVDQVIAATGFLPTITNPLLKSLCDEHNLSTFENVLEVDNRFRIPKLSNNESGAFVVGQAAAWVLPSADSLVGMRIAARAITDQIVGGDSWHVHELRFKTQRWAQLVTGYPIS